MKHKLSFRTKGGIKTVWTSRSWESSLFVWQFTDLHFLRVSYWGFLSILWLYHSLLMLCDPWFLTLESAHLSNQVPLLDLQVCFGRDSFSPVSSTSFSGCVWGWCPWPEGTCYFGLFAAEATVWVLRMRTGACLCLKAFGSNCWLEFLLSWGCRMSSAVAWILWPDLLDVQGRDVICSTVCCRTGPTTSRTYSLKAWVCWNPRHEAISCKAIICKEAKSLAVLSSRATVLRTVAWATQLPTCSG